MRDEFIRFLKNNHAFEEFKKEILIAGGNTFDDLDVQFKDGGAEFVLNDGCIFFWKSAVTNVLWQELDSAWRSELKKKGMLLFSEVEDAK